MDAVSNTNINKVNSKLPVDAKPETDPEKVAEAAEKFESFFLTKLMESMRKTMPTKGLLGKGMANDVYNSFMDQALSEQMSKAGGIGLGKMLANSFGAERAIGNEINAANQVTERAVKMVSEGIGSDKEKPHAPIKGSWLGSRFGKRFSTRTQSWHFHKGIDLNVPEGTPIKATLGGTIRVARDVKGYGNAVYIDHGNGLQSRYGHASKLLVKEGQQVKTGETIALSGNTGLSDGPHLHFEVRLDNVAVDPEPFLGTEEMQNAATNYINKKPLYQKEQFDNETKDD